MDIIALQAANKVIKRMNTEYNGFQHVITATAGQKVFDLPKQFAPGTHTLEVHVDGAQAILGTDYTETDNDTITFVDAMVGGEQVVFSTRVVGIPRTEIINPPYDDTQVKADIQQAQTDISTIKPDVTQAKADIGELKTDMSQAKVNITNINGEIANIKAAMDEDGDGSIIDTIADIKQQWADADGDLNTLIGNKAEQSALDATNTTVGQIQEDLDIVEAEVSEMGEQLTDVIAEIEAAKGASASLLEELTAIKSSIPEAYDDSVLSQAVSDLDANVDDINNILDSAKGSKTSIAQRFTDVEQAVAAIPAPYDDAALAERVTDLEGKTLDNFKITDTQTGWEYKLTITGGVLSIDLIKKLLSVILNRAGAGTIYKGDTINFNKSAMYTDTRDATADTTFVFSVDNGTVASINETTGAMLALEEGVVTVTLTGINKGIQKTASAELTIYLTDAQTVEKAKQALDVAVASSIADLSAVTGDLVLEATKLGANIAWTSDNEEVISIGGSVMRPSGLIGDVDVTLTATITKGIATDTKVFVAHVVALPLTDGEHLQIAKTNLTLGDISAVVDNLVLPAAQDGATITWASSNEAVIANDGTVARPANGSGDTVVTMTATITYGTANDTKTFDVTVLELPA